MSKVLEQKVEIKGEIGSSFIQAFKSATDNMSDLRQEARQVQRELDRLGNDFRSGKIHQSQYAEETRKLTSELNRLEQRQKTMSTLKNQLNTGWNNVKATAAIGAVGAATAGTAMAVKSLNVAADFEAQMSKVGAKTDATKEEMNALTQTALELGAKTSLSASESALAMDELAAGGFSVNAIIKAMPGIIAGAEASGEDLALVSSTVSSALSVWGLEAEKASKVSDVLAKSANISAASVEDFSYAFKYAGKPAADLGLSLEQTAAAISIMTDAGIDGSSAGTSLRAALLKLANPTKKQNELMKKYGISLEDSSGNAKPLPKLIGEIDKAMGGLSNVDKTAALGTLVGTEAVSGFMTLMSAGEEKLDSFTKQLENSAGSSAKASKVMMDNFAGAKEQMFGAFESAQIAAATPSLDVLKRTFQGVGAMIEANLPAIEAAGQNVANVLEEIFAPFIAYEEPLKPVITPEMDPNDAKSAMAEYQEALAKHDLFGKMDLGDKVDYMLDQTIDHVSAWVQGDGGEKMQDLFAELAAIAAGAWSSSFTTLLKGSMSELAEGDIGSAVAMGAAANAMTGGLLMTGGVAGGKYLLGKGKGLIGKGKVSTAAAVPTVATTNPKSTKAATAPITKPSAKPNFVETTSKASKLGTFSKYAGKAALPLTLATGAISVATSNNKAEAAGSVGGSLAGGLGGAKLGAAIGTAIAPGIGTAIGGALGGLAGSIAGSSVGGKIGNFFSGNKSSSASAQPAPQQTANTASSNEAVNQFNTTIAGLNEKAMSLSTSLTGLTTTFETTNTNMTTALLPVQTNTTALATNLATLNTETALAGINTQTAFTAITTSANLLLTNLNTLATNLSTASAGIAAINNIGSASQRVVSALNRLEQRINSASIPGTSGGGRLAYE